MRQWTIDAFAAAPFKGNPACVLEPADAFPADSWMQALAAENNQAETAFLRRTADPARFDLRWFTPALEVPLCGHATLASAHALFAELGLEADEGTGFDVVSRFFAPGSGIAEDAATGSMHCMLSPMFADRLGRKTLRFHQAYPGRGADLECEHRGDRVLLRGRAVTVAESVLRL